MAFEEMDDILSLALEQSGLDALIPANLTDLAAAYLPESVGSFQGPDGSLPFDTAAVLPPSSTYGGDRSNPSGLPSNVDDDLSALLESTSTDYLMGSLPIVPTSTSLTSSELTFFPPPVMTQTSSSVKSMDVDDVLLQLGLFANEVPPPAASQPLLAAPNGILPSTMTPVVSVTPINNLRFVPVLCHCVWRICYFP